MIGSNQVTVYFFGGYFQTLANSLGATNFYFQTTSGNISSSSNSKLPITITDLGTTSLSSTFPPYTFGQTLKGNYTGTIYLQNNNGQFTIPIQLSIDFKALRMY
jgi:hypothetical protein